MLYLAQAERSIPSVAEVGKTVMSFSTWNKGNDSLRLSEKFDAPEVVVQDLMDKLVNSLPVGWNASSLRLNQEPKASLA